MTVSEQDRERMRQIARDPAASETDDRGTPAERAARREWLNERRADIGLPPLDGLPGEEGFYRRARALGMARIDRPDAGRPADPVGDDRGAGGEPLPG